MKQYLEAGEFVTTHGVLGELKLYPWCDEPGFIAGLDRLYFTAQGGGETQIETVRIHKGMCLVKLKGVDSLDAARLFVRKIAYFNRDDAPLPPGRYYVQDIIGCRVIDADTGMEYGEITAISHPAASDVYTVRSSMGEEYLFPAVSEFLDRLEPAAGAVYVRPIPGMFGAAENGDGGGQAGAADGGAKRRSPKGRRKNDGPAD